MRPKLGFCNCDRGVADDDEVDRVADLDLISRAFRAAARPGDVVRVADMQGRIRAYDLKMQDGSPARRHRHRGVAGMRSLGGGGAGKGDAAEVKRAAMKFLSARRQRAG